MKNTTLVFSQSHAIKPGGFYQIWPMAMEFHQDKSDKASLFYKYCCNEDIEMCLHKSRVSLLSKKKSK